MILLDGSSLTLDELLAIADDEPAGRALRPTPPRASTRRARSSIARRSAIRRSTASTPGSARWPRPAIPRDALGALQVNLLRSHAAGVGEPLPVRAVRASMALRANVLAKGFSGIRRATLERLIDLLNRRVHPRVPSRGSVGASGDLAPLAHLSLVLIGEGEAWVGDAPALRPGRDALAAAGLSPVTLGPKEGLALINGTQPSTAVGALAVAGAERLARAADVAAALSIDGLRGSVHPFDARIHEARPYAGPGDLGRQHPRAARRQRRSTSRTSTAAACRTPTRCAARRRCTARRARR